MLSGAVDERLSAGSVSMSVMMAIETAALVVPVTALEFLREEYLLTGEGPILTVYRLQSQTKASTSLSVLLNYRIHGIRPKPQTGVRRTSDPDDEVVVFGGKAVRLLRLSAGGQRLEPLGPLMELPDWALDVSWVSGEKGPLGVALAHNAALLLDPVQGCVLALCSCQEGCLLYSALLLGENWEDSVLVGGTVFNQLVLWRPGGAQPDGKAPVERRLPGHSGVIFSLCYRRETGWLASASDDRSVRVWGVGDLGGAGGGCGDPSPTCLRVLYGHQARVFSVKLSPGRVYSAGEDGACLLWDWGGRGRVARTLKGHRSGGVRALAVSEGGDGQGRWVATGGADGGIRLWRVGGEEEKGDAVGGQGEAESLVDLGFQGRGVPKVVGVVGDGHWIQGRVVVNTDHGEVYLYEGGRWGLLWEGGPEFQSYCVMEVLRVRGWGAAASREGLCALGSLSGGVQVFPLSQPGAGVLLRAGPGKVHSVLWVKGQAEGQGRGGYLLASGAEGLVHRWQVEVEMRDTGLALRVEPLCPLLLPPCAKRWLTAVVYLNRPQGALWVCGDRRGSLLLFEEREHHQEKKRGAGEEHEDEEMGREAHNGLVESHDEKGDVVVGEEDEEREASRAGLTLQPGSSLFGVHGKQGVTWVSEHRGLLYSAGRDGCVRVLRVGPEGLEVLRVQRACRGMEWLERVLLLEPHDSEEEQRAPEPEGSGKEARFVIVGFHSVHFVVWDPVRQERLLSVLCGGGHRSWSYCPHQDGLSMGQGALVFIKQGVVLASEPSGEAPSRAGSLDLRQGLHGRGVGCVCRLGVVGEAGEGRWEVLVTGGEDTSLTVLAVRPQTGTVRVLSVITDHISNVRTLTAVKRLDRGTDEQTAAQSLSALLVSAGGRAQMQCYRLLIGGNGQLGLPSCQVIQVASHRLDDQWERMRNRHKTVKMDAETRYMSIAVVDDGTESVLLALACSDGAVRLFSVSELTGKFELLWESFHHERCVLSIATCSLEDGQGNRRVFLFSAATDGRIAVWDMSTVANSEDRPPTAALAPTSPCLTVPAHQNGVNTLAVWEEGLGAGHTDEARITLASGGDDGQLSVALIRVQYQGGAVGGSRVCLQLQSQWSVALAHAAPLTALRMLSPGLLVSTSPDQRVCLWRLATTGLSQQGALVSHVADAAGLEVWIGAEAGVGAVSGCGDRGWVVVCGQGLQLLKVTDVESGGNREGKTGRKSWVGGREECVKVSLHQHCLDDKTT
ncbi:WD repeat-containing protein 6-like [Salvelinus fontinalis]|uniref:WD repeat-containing protein 6-like n=1 Tax=Salvelinus fontinalis TaxID=8038 RepID=UPI00248529AD|nr:WD repeat-containing protein 6-like [Salvelinus fontinalis]